MSVLHFPHIRKPEHKIQNVNVLYQDKASLGQQMADRVARIVGSWRFIIFQTILLLIWIIINTIAISMAWDPYPFILMNLVLSTQAAFTAPIIMMSQNQQAIKDRIDAQNDYMINQKSEQEIEIILEQLTAQNEALRLIYEKIEQLEGKQNQS